MGEAPGEGPELHDADEARQIEDLPLQVLAIADAAEVEQLCPCACKAPQSVTCRHCSISGGALIQDVGSQSTLRSRYAALAWLQQAKRHICFAQWSLQYNGAQDEQLPLKIWTTLHGWQNPG